MIINTPQLNHAITADFVEDYFLSKYCKHNSKSTKCLTFLLGNRKQHAMLAIMCLNAYNSVYNKPIELIRTTLSAIDIVDINKDYQKRIDLQNTLSW